MSMSKYQRVTKTCEVMERQFPIGTKPDWIDCTLANDLLEYWNVQRREVEAAEKIPEPQQTWERLQQLANWCTALDVESTASRRCQEQMSKRMAALERRLESHSHDFFRNGPIEGGTIGPICP